ncbi:uncharacterized protein LOC129322507 [Prosopis cineraria]|uniref:uncharacterized protein LOC129322507 n=1 Tax=Prosopis cineraria TaxID=364024 RepID=UPI00241018A1|nr:uncharacterized protein LOC129322507 [Prosopis cineraria]
MTRDEAKASPKLIRGTILLCGHQIDALFDSSATHSFISDNCAKRLNLHVLEMLFAINVSTPAGAFVRTSQACLKLELKFSDRVSVIDLICLLLSGIDVIVGMDLLSANGTTLDCNRKIVSLPVYTATIVNHEPVKSLSVVDLYDGGMDIIGVVNEFPQVFDDQMSGLPPEREIEFFLIALVPGTEPISKALYHMAPAELEELKKQLEELLEKGFI